MGDTIRPSRTRSVEDESGREMYHRNNGLAWRCKSCVRMTCNKGKVCTRCLNKKVKDTHGR